jgi:hypothetical protein
VSVLTKLFQGLRLAKLLAAHKAGRLTFFGQHTHLAARKGLRGLPGAAAQNQLVRLFKAPFGGPKAVLA